MSETFERSCAHWSEAKRGEMEAFYALATADYRVLAEAMDWVAWLTERQRAVGDRPLRLLDVACGSGKFPVALASFTELASAPVQPIAYSLLDPSAFSIREARAVLGAPFTPDEEFEIPLQDLTCARGAFDVAWATHALYAVPPAELPVAMERFLHALGDDGVGVIAHSAAEGHYIRFHRDFLEAFGGDADRLYSSAEQIRSALEDAGARVETRQLAYENGVPESARSEVEGFLQRCAFDDAHSLDAMLAAEPLASYLATCIEDGHWRFPQRVDLMVVTA